MTSTISYLKWANLPHTVKHTWFNHLKFSGYVSMLHNSNTNSNYSINQLVFIMETGCVFVWYCKYNSCWFYLNLIWSINESSPFVNLLVSTVNYSRHTAWQWQTEHRIKSLPRIFRCVIPIVLCIIEEGLLFKSKHKLWFFFIIILTTCFALDNGSSSGNKAYVRGYYTVWFTKRDIISYNLMRFRCSVSL